MTNVERLLIGIAELEMSENQQDSKKIKKELRKTISEIQSNKKTAEAIVREIMAELGSPESLIGFPYIIKGILMCVENENMINQITFRLYPEIAACFDTTASRVERGIRHVVEVIFTRGDEDAIAKYFRNSISPDKGKVTNGEFIARIANIVRFQLSV